MTDRLRVGERTGGRRVRMSPSARRAELIRVARRVVAAGGLVDGGMAEVAAEAGVSNGLLYHYFPAGRPELVDAVGHQLLDELCDRMTTAANLPFSPLGRLEQALAVLFGFFTEFPVALRLMFPTGDGPAAGDGVHHLAQVRLVAAITGLMAGSGVPAVDLLAGATELLGLVSGEVARCLDAEVEPEPAWRESCRRAQVLFAEAG